MLGAVRFVTAQTRSVSLLRKQFDKLEFGGESPLTMRAWCVVFRYCPNPLGIVTAEAFVKLEFGGESPLTMRARCGMFRYCPNPLGIVPAEAFVKLELLT